MSTSCARACAVLCGRVCSMYVRTMELMSDGASDVRVACGSEGARTHRACNLADALRACAGAATGQRCRASQVMRRFERR